MLQAVLVSAGTPASSGSWISVLIGVVGGGIPAFVAWWRSTRVARQRADDQAWLRANETMVRQGKELEDERKRADRCDRNMRLALHRVDRLVGLLETNGVAIPPHLMTRPWEDGNNNNNNDPGPTKKEGT